MTNKTTPTREGKLLLDIPIKNNPHAYFNEGRGSKITEEVVQHLEKNPSRYYAVIIPKMIFCSGSERILGALASQARSVEFLVGLGVGQYNIDSSPLIGEKYGPQKTVEFFNTCRYEEIESPSVITPDKTLREIISMSYEILEGSEKTRRDGLVKYLETIQ